jgi:pantoate--beta-alanine ligase
MLTVDSIAAVRETIGAWRAAGQRIAFVPTMGNLHAGHISLIELARKHGDRFVASIFVNPMQFGPNEDFNHYPRTPERDAQMLAAAGCDLMFMPHVEEIYPNGERIATRVHVPEISSILCGEFRPGHFEGVATIVAKLFNIVQPDVAIFGEKDFQQLTIVRRMASDLCLPVRIVGAPTMREPDGLAMSSRIYAELKRARAAILAGARDYVRIEAECSEALAPRGLRVEYFAVRRVSDLQAATRTDLALVVLCAARLGRARLIDNVTVTLAAA